MITRLRLQNFRRHDDTELVFDDDAQIILIEGRNGAGKSTILEAIVMALYGEGRHGRKHLDTLTRRGAELEGMEVELEFRVGGDLYRVVRRRDGRASTAVLFGNEVALVEGPNAVTEEITKILGMDAAGFRLAVIAQQKDIDGLASLRPAERNQMIRRLLRLDAITAARDNANNEFRRQRDLVRNLRGGDELAELRNLRDDTIACRDGAAREHGKAAAAVAAAESELAATGEVDLAFEAAQRRKARAEERLAGERQEVERLRQVLSAQLPPQPPVRAAAIDIAAVSDEVSRLGVAISRAENESSLVEQREVTLGEIDRVTARLVEVHAARDAARDAARRRGELAAELAALDEQVLALQDDVTGLREQLGEAGAELARLETQLLEAQTLGGVCDTCGQDVPELHRQQHIDLLSDAKTRAQIRLDAVKEEGRARIEDLNERRRAAEQLRGEMEQLTREALSAERLEAEESELDRRLATYRKQAERLPERSSDPAALIGERDRLRGELAAALQANEEAAERSKLIERRTALTEQLAAALERAGQAELELERALIPAELVAGKERRRQLDESRQAEAQLLSHWAKEEAVFTERLANLERQLERAQGEADRKATVEADAVAHANAARLLGDVADKLAAEIRPALEGAVSTMLSTVSDGRFSQVRIDEDYAVTVKDDGEFRSLSEVSGGEADLIALAMRLALAQVVAERHGSGGAGFLILDEPFGSQDPGRRESILTAMRQLRSVYSQIFLISHIENIEDAADLVVTVAASEDRSETEVTVR